jgi:hypothetical protein
MRLQFKAAVRAALRRSSILFACVGMMLGAQCLAGTGNGTINPGWNVYVDGVVFFHLSGPHYSPQCSAIPDRWAFNTTTPVGKSMFATFMLAYSQGRSVSIIGDPSTPCIHGNTEAVLTIAVMD